jgi:thioredoxin-dependent peroxiredoxin
VVALLARLAKTRFNKKFAVKRLAKHHLIIVELATEYSVNFMVELKIGDAAPDFNLIDEKGFPVRLKDFLGSKTVILYFYPKDFTPGCTKEACSFRDEYKAFEERGTVVVGVSVDSVESHAKFSKKYALPFALLSDNQKEVARQYGVLGIGGILTHRMTFIINKEGKISAVFPKVDVKQHAQEVLKAISSDS